MARTSRRWCLSIGVAIGAAIPVAELLLECGGANFDGCTWDKQLLPFTLPLGMLLGLFFGALAHAIWRIVRTR